MKSVLLCQSVIIFCYVHFIQCHLERFDERRKFDQYDPFVLYYFSWKGNYLTCAQNKPAFHLFPCEHCDCLDREKICNGEYDCENGADEHGLDCSGDGCGTMNNYIRSVYKDTTHFITLSLFFIGDFATYGEVCVGSHLLDDWIATSASCIMKFTNAVGEINVTSTIFFRHWTGEHVDAVYTSNRTMVHPKFHKDSRFDIGLIHIPLSLLHQEPVVAKALCPPSPFPIENCNLNCKKEREMCKSL